MWVPVTAQLLEVNKSPFEAIALHWLPLAFAQVTPQPARSLYLSLAPVSKPYHDCHRDKPFQPETCALSYLSVSASISIALVVHHQTLTGCHRLPGTYLTGTRKSAVNETAPLPP